jgi:hypothetical protein
MNIRMQMKNIYYLLVIVVLIVIVIIFDSLDYYSNNNIIDNADNVDNVDNVNRFIDIQPTVQPIVNYEKNKTLLYGSLFLDKLDEQIKNMTDPRIQYDNKRIDIVKYSDVLL